MMAERPGLSDAELEILKGLWGRGPSTVREALESAKSAGRSWAYTTVMTLLHRLRDKGYVVVDASGPAHVFRAAMTREELLRHGLDDLAVRLCEGAPAPLVLALVRGGRFSPDELARFRTLLDELEGRAAGGPSGGLGKARRRKGDRTTDGDEGGR